MDSTTRQEVYLRHRATLTAPQRRRLAKKAHKDVSPIIGKQGRLRKRLERKQDGQRRQQIRAMFSLRRGRAT